MSDIVNAFKQTKGYKKRKNLLSDTQEVAQQPQEQDNQNQAVNASQQQNVALETSGTKDSDRLAQLEQLAAAETAQNEANRQAAAAANEAQKQAEEAQRKAQEQANIQGQAQQLSRADASRRNFDDINNGTNSLYNDYVNAYNTTKDSYKNIVGESASGIANYHINNVLKKVQGQDDNALSNSQSFMNAYNKLSADDKWDVYQNLQDAKSKLKQAYAVAEKNSNSMMMDNLSTMYKYADMYEGMISDVEKGDKSFFKSIGDWFAGGAVTGDLAQPVTNALGDITGNTETSKAISDKRATQEEGNNPIVGFLDTGSNLVANTGLNVVTGGWYGLGTAGANLAHEGLSALNDADREYGLNQEGKLERQNQTNEQKIADMGGALFNLGLSAAGMKGVGPNIKFSGGQTLQNLVKSKDYGEIAKGLLKYAGKELPWAAATTAGETGIRSFGYGEDAWKTYGQDLLNNIVGDLGMDVTGAISEGQSGNRDLFRINQETGKVELDNSVKTKLSDEDNAKVQQRLDEFQEGIKNAVDNEGKVEQETGRVDENGKVEDTSRVDETKLNQDAKSVSDETNARITAEQMARNSENSQRVNQNTENLRDMLNESQKQAYNKQVEAIRAELQDNKISYDQYIQRIEQIQNQFIQQAQSGQVEQQEQSATGQKVNPEDVSNIVEGAEGTQASEATTKQTAPVEQFSEARSEATTRQNEMGEGMARTEGEDPIERAYDSARQRYQEALESGDRGAIEAARERYNQILDIKVRQDAIEFTDYNYNNGIKVNDVLAQKMFNDGYDSAKALADQMFDITEGNVPLAYDYGTGTPLYMYEDIVDAMRKYGGKDVIGNQFQTSRVILDERTNAQNQAFRQALEESIARSEQSEGQTRDGNFSVTDGINNRTTINGAITTYNGDGEWNGARVFRTDGEGIPTGYKLMADENAAPADNYVAIINDNGEKALIELPHGSEYDYERVGLATGTTRESLASNGLVESTNTEPDTDAINDLLAQASEADNAPVIDQAFDDRMADEYGRQEMAGEDLPGTPETNTEQPVDENIFRQQDMARRQELLQAYNEIGMTPELQQKIQEANRNMVDSGAKTADLSALTPQEMDIYRRTLEFFKPTENVESSMNRAYLPQQYEMDTEGYANRRIQEFLDTGKNDKYWEQSRTGAVAESGRMDYSNNALVDFHMRAEDPMLMLQEAGYDMAQELNPDATQDQKIEAANDIAETVAELNNKAEAGAENGISDKDIQGMKPADKLSEAGKKLGIQKEQINNTPKGFSDYEKLKSLNQWENGARFNDMQNLDALSQNTAQEVDAMIQGYENLSDKAKTEILSHRRQLEEHFTESTGSPEMGTYLANRAMLKDAWTQNMMNYATKVEFTNKASKKLMNEYVARYLLKDRYEQSVVQKVGSAIQRVMNSSFRGARVQTTLNEIPEIFTSMADYGTLKTASIRPSQAQAIKAKYGMSNGGSYEQFMNTLPKADRAEIQTRLENAKSANEQISIFKEAARKAGKVIDTADGATQWNGFVQDWKDATFLQNAERYYTQKGLSGTELTNRVLDDFYQRMLPMSRVFKYIKSDAGITKPILMYLDSSARLTMKAARGAIGSNMVGVNANMGRMHRIARNAAFDLAPRAVSALVMGVPLASVIGMFNIGGADYSGIDDEDKNMTDQIVNFFGQLSPLLSLASYGYNQSRQEEIAKAKGQDTTNLKGDAGQRTLDNILKTFTPLGNRLDQDYGIFGNINSTKDVLERGSAINKQGRVQYLSPDNPIDMVNALISGVNRTSNAREYNKNPDLLSALINQARGKDYNGDGNTDGGFNDFIRYNQALNEFPLDIGLKDENDYNRPLNQYENSNYSGKVQEALQSGDRQTAQEWYEKGRAYNALLDNLRVKNPDAADVYYASMGNNLVSPEKWKTVLYGQNPNGEPDLTVWNLMKDMALKRGEDFNTPVDPAYTNLDDEQTRRYLQYKSTATGEDTALKKIMTQDPFWKEFFNQQKEYYASLPESEYDDSSKTARVQEWNNWNDQYSDYMSFISGNLDGMNDQQLGLSLSLQFPLMAEYQSLKTALQSKYGDEYKNSQEYKNFWSQNYDAYSAESDAFNGQMLYIINQMRRIEGYDDLTLDELETINNIGKESKSSSKSGGSGKRRSGGSSGDGGYSYAPYFENTFQAAPVYAKVPNAGKMRYNPAGRANFNKVPMSGTMGGQPYAAV